MAAQPGTNMRFLRSRICTTLILFLPQLVTFPAQAGWSCRQRTAEPAGCFSIHSAAEHSTRSILSARLAASQWGIAELLFEPLMAEQHGAERRRQLPVPC